MDSRPRRTRGLGRPGAEGPGKSVPLGYVTAAPPPDFVAPPPTVTFNRVNTVKDGGSARRNVLVAASVVGIASLLCLLAILALYIANVTPWAPLFAVGLYGLPIAFLLLAALVVMNLAERRRS